MVKIAQTFGAMSAQRLFVFGGLVLIVVGMVFGDVFAVFILHQNAGGQGAALVAAAESVARQDADGAGQAFRNLGGLLEDHGTKVDTHSHMIGAGYLALILAIAQPYVALALRTKLGLARLFVGAGVALPIGIFTIHYLGLAYSPFSAIGWASVLADLSGFVMAVVVIIELWGLWSYFRSADGPVEDEVPQERSWARRTLLAGGAGLVLLGFLDGAYYAAVDLYHDEKMEGEILGAMVRDAMAGGGRDIGKHASDFGNLAGEHAVQLAAHAHAIEFGLLAFLLSFIQPFVFLSEVWRRRWVITLLVGSLVLPVAVALELRFGLLAGGIADAGGLLVIVALSGMLAGVIRYAGRLDFAEGQR